MTLGKWLLSLAVLTALMAGPTISAQSVENITITPPAPNENDVIHTTIAYRVPGLFCSHSVSTAVNGNTIRTTIFVNSCEPVFPLDPLHTISDQFGPLPPGSYTYEVIFQLGTLPPIFGAQQPLIVAPAITGDIPMLRPSVLAALALLLAALGIVVLRQH